MSFSVDYFIMKQYDGRNYNCWHFACDVWSSLTGQVYCPDPIDKLDNVSYLHERALEMTGQFTTLEKPKSPCFVLMRRQRIPPHVGIYLNGKVLALNERGASYVDLDHATACYPTVTYHAPK